MDTDYDAIIAGGGISGMLTATSLAVHSDQNIRIALIDRNPPETVGRKTVTGWICGDATSKNSVDYLSKNLKIQYSEPEIEHAVKGVLVYSPDHQTRILFEGEGYVLNRKLLPQRQMNDAKKVGVDFHFGIALEGLLSNDGFVVGVHGRNLRDKSNFKRTAKIIIDATGSASKLRKNLPVPSQIQKQIDMDDMESTGRYIYEFDYGQEDKTFFDPEYCLIHLDQYLAPGGYSWVFPKGNHKVNIGLGVQKKALDRRNDRFGKHDTLQTLIDEYVRINSVIRNPRFPQEDDGNENGNWQVPVRRHNDSMVAGGYAIVGDAAWMPRPIDAGGIGPAIYGGVILGRVAAEAIEAGDVSEGALWRYNLDYMKLYGYNMTSFEVLRKYLQTLTNPEISYGLKHFMSQEDVDNITKREHPKFDRIRFFNPLMWFRIASHKSLATGLRYTARKSAELIEHNLDYPESPQGFAKWKQELLLHLREADRRFVES